MTSYVAWCVCGWYGDNLPLDAYTRHDCPAPMVTVTTTGTYRALLDQTLPRERQET